MTELITGYAMIFGSVAGYFTIGALVGTLVWKAFSPHKAKAIESPTKILAQLISMRVLQEPENVKRDCFISKDERIGVTYARSSGFITRATDIIIDGERVSLTPTEAAPIVAACQSADETNIKRRETEIETSRQHKALNAIESVLLSPVKD